MSIQAVVRSVRLYMRSEALLAEIKLRTFLRRMALATIALAVALMALAMLNIAAYAHLLSLWGPVWTPLALALVNLVIAALAIAAALMTRGGAELALAEELRQSSASALEGSVQSLRDEPGLLAAIGGRAFDTRAASLVIPAIASVISALRSKDKSAKG